MEAHKGVSSKQLFVVWRFRSFDYWCLGWI